MAWSNRRKLIYVTMFLCALCLCGKLCFSPHSVHRGHAGESEKVLRDAFAEASSHAASDKPSVIFIDEIDVLCPRRDSRYCDT